ncbi:hypothetical protein B2J93_8614 [Marssonina coronariae]|uniref:Uncharacterized protein n=1 Tax=Diplocarpon coronariae TaxID=2795749 RepID=A0A218YXK9_9HELO|nr:hypothetical protein B2J93_8614 [Marssonina coronariae]
MSQSPTAGELSRYNNSTSVAGLTQHDSTPTANNAHIAEHNLAATSTRTGQGEHDDQTSSYAPYALSSKDWLLFNSSLPAIEYETDRFFEDADACVGTSPAASTPDARSSGGAALLDLSDLHEELRVLDSREEHCTGRLAPERPLQDEGEREDEDEDEEEQEQEDLLYDWAWDYQRHEWIATKFEGEPYTTARRPPRPQR